MGIGSIALVAAALMVGVATPGRAEALRLTLEDAVRRALETGEEMRLSKILTLEADGRVREAFSGALPQITGSVGYTRQIASVFEDIGADSGLASVFSNSPFGAANRWNAEVTASQRIFSGGKVGAGIRAARAVRRSARAQEDETALEVAYDVKRAYLDAAYAARRVEIAENGLAQARDHLREVELHHGEGMTAEYDLLRAQVDAANQEPPAVAARNDLEIALLELKRLVNVPLEQPVTLVTPLGFAGDMVPVVAEDAGGTEARPAMAAADADVQARRQLLRVQRGFRWPDLTLSTTLSHQAFPRDGLPHRDEFRRNWEASLSLDFPIFLGFRTEGQIQRARAEFERAEVRREQLRETVRIEIAEARAELARARSLLAARRGTVRQAQRARDIAAVRYANGMSTQLDVSDVRLQLQVAEVNEAQATHDYLLSLARLERVIGRPLRLERKPLEEATAMRGEEGGRP